MGADAVAAQIKLPHVTPESPVGMGLCLSATLPICLPVNGPEKAGENGPSRWVPPPTWEASIEHLT